MPLRRVRLRRTATAPLALLASVAASCAPARGPADLHAEVPDAPRPTLVVLLTIDQFRADYLRRFGPQMTGGIARLTRGGAHFLNAHQDHAIPETAAGHALLLAGRFPRSTNIILNSGAVTDTTAPLVGAAGSGASPTLFVGTTLVDWLKREDPASRALSVSGKDRSAILPIGRAREQVYWYSGEGRFVTSTYYTNTLPPWVEAYNARDGARRRAGQTWTPLLGDAAYPERDDEPLEAGGNNNVFPHQLPSDSAGAAAYLIVTPWLDEMILDFALTGVNALALGGGPRTDILSVSLSASDAIGHLYGPDSKEMHDQALRLDRAIGVFLDSLGKLRPASQTVVVLTADHGIAPLPEMTARRSGSAAWRVDPDGLLHQTRDGLTKSGISEKAVDAYLGLVFVDRAALQRGGLKPDSVVEALTHQMRMFPGIQRVDRFTELRPGRGSLETIPRRWLQLLPADAKVELVATLQPQSVWLTGNVASHHSPHDYDTHVPLVFHGAPFRAGKVEDFVRLVDLAPTLAAALGVRPLERLDGVVLRKALRAP